jgi:hypothetical protein
MPVRGSPIAEGNPGRTTSSRWPVPPDCRRRRSRFGWLWRTASGVCLPPSRGAAAAPTTRAAPLRVALLRAEAARLRSESRREDRAAVRGARRAHKPPKSRLRRPAKAAPHRHECACSSDFGSKHAIPEPQQSHHSRSRRRGEILAATCCRELRADIPIGGTAPPWPDAPYFLSRLSQRLAAARTFFGAVPP